MLSSADENAVAREIRVELREVDGHVAFTVRDTGTGIDESVLANLLDGGHAKGVGLSFCKTVVEAHDGFIAGGNSTEGGACFTFCLPMEEERV